MVHPAAAELDAPALVSLAEAEAGRDFLIRRIEGPGCEELRRLGFCESLHVRKLAGGRNLICSVCGARLAICRELAEQVMLSPVPAP